MQLVEVIPIARGISADTLSYFTGKNVSPGEIVKVPVRSRIIPAMVVAVRSAEEARSDIRGASFETKKLEAVSGKRILSKQFMLAANECADYFATTTGSVLGSLLPKSLLGSLTDLPELGETLRSMRDTTPERVVMQAENTERLSHYKSLIREEFARNRSVVILVPTIQDGTLLFDTLARGIEAFAYFFHSDMPKKRVLDAWKTLGNDPHPVLAIVTGSYLCLPRNDIGVVIVEHESSRAYKLPYRPYLDIRIFAEKYAGHLGARFFLADLPLRVETLSRFQSGEVDEFSKLRARSVSAAASKIIDARRKTDAKKRMFSTLTEELLEALQQTLAEGKRAYLFCARRGLSPMTLCGDCESVVSCNVCEAAVVLHKAGKENAFVCHSCGAIRSAHERCKVCGGWKLITLGIGIEKVKEELAEKFPDIPLYILEKETAKSHREATAVAKKFYAAAPAILLGTELSIPYVEKPVGLVGVVSADSLLSLPEWRSQERLFSTLLTLRAAARDVFLVQTREPDHRVILLARDGNVIEFFKEELARRITFRYPPATVLVKLSIEGSRTRVATMLSALETDFSPYGFLPYAPSIHLGHSRYLAHGLIRASRAAWPNPTLLRKLRELSPEIAIDVEPHTLL